MLAAQDVGEAFSAIVPLVRKLSRSGTHGVNIPPVRALFVASAGCPVCIFYVNTVHNERD